MKREILSLKSLYRFLVISDYPTYSEGIISKNNHKGLTLNRFWQDNLLIDFKKHKYGRIIWRTEGGRNRYISEICNRSGELKFYGEYAEEILDEANGVTVLHQIKQFMSFLVERQFCYDAFIKKLPVYIDLLAKNDELFEKEVESFFRDNLRRQKEFGEKGSIEKAFFCGWFLTFLMFHALLGSREGKNPLQKLRNNPALSMKELARDFHPHNEKKQKKVTFLTGKNTELCATPLDMRHFFGREEELFELREMLERGGRYLVSGIGGIGKTELMRQFLRCCREESLTDYICVVQYENNLTDSLIKAFPQVRGRKRDENFEEALAIIRMHAQERILMIIDNMTCGDVEDEGLKILASLPATIFITSRYQKLNDFVTYQVKPISKDAGSLVFRDIYKVPLQKEDKPALQTILDNDVWCHTLTLRLLANVAASRGWNLQKLLQQLKKGDASTGLSKQDGYESLKEVYCKMYETSGLPQDLNSLLQIFAILPYASYTQEFAKRFLQGYLAEDASVPKSLESLWQCGWLEKRENAYSMHPFIAECIRKADLSEEDVAPFFESVIAEWEKTKKGFNVESVQDVLYDWNWRSVKQNIREQELQHATSVICHIAKKAACRFGERFVQLILMAVGMEYHTYGPCKETLILLSDLKARNGHISPNTKICLFSMLCCYGYGDAEELEREYKKLMAGQEAEEPLKQEFLEEFGQYCIHLGKHLLCKEIADYLWKEGITPERRMGSCALHGALLLGEGDLEGYMQWLEKGAEIGREAGREKSREMYDILYGLCGVYLPRKQFEKVQKILEEMDGYLKEGGNYVSEWHRLFYQGAMELYRGDEGHGVKVLEEASRLAEPLFVGVEDITYASCLAELAMACHREEMWEESSKYYKKILGIYENEAGHDFEKMRILNNMGVMYLDWNKPKEALECLEKAWKTGKAMGGLPAAENANNLSRAWGMLGDREKELSYLQGVIPVLEQFYGSEHPKVVDTKKRLAER